MNTLHIHIGETFDRHNVLYAMRRSWDLNTTMATALWEGCGGGSITKWISSDLKWNGFERWYAPVERNSGIPRFDL